MRELRESLAAIHSEFVRSCAAIVRASTRRVPDVVVTPALLFLPGLMLEPVASSHPGARPWRDWQRGY